MISDFLSKTTITDLNMASNFTGAIAGIKALPIANKSLDISRQSLDVARESLAISIKLYNEFEETHNIEEERYYESKKLQESYLDIMQQMLIEIKRLNENLEKKN